MIRRIYSLRSVILFANVDVSRYILVIDASVLAKCNMGRKEYYNIPFMQIVFRFQRSFAFPG
jgi:hypothetical protein